jgi:hypothetical protein
MAQKDSANCIVDTFYLVKRGWLMLLMNLVTIRCELDGAPERRLHTR